LKRIEIGKNFTQISSLRRALASIIFKAGDLSFPFTSRLIRNQLNRVAPVGLVEVKIAAGNLSGKPFIIDMQTEKDYWLGTYEPELQAAIRTWVKPGMVVYDIGANVGYITLMLEQATGQNWPSVFV